MKMSVVTIPPPEMDLASPYGGGFFVCNYLHVDRPAQLIVAPKWDGEFTLSFKDEWSTTPGAQSVIDGFANSEAMNDKHHPAAWWCRQLRIGGHDDWYSPARDQLEMLHRYLKPSDKANYVYESRLKTWGVKAGTYNGVDKNGNGHNAHLGSMGEPYTKDNPTQTSADLFKAGGAEAFAARWYLSSTEVNAACAWAQGFGDGNQANVHKGDVLGVRAVRHIFLNN